MKNTKREIILIIGILLTLGISSIIISQLQKDNHDKDFELSFIKQEAETFKTKSGKQAARIKTLEGSINNITTVYTDSLHKLEKELNIKSKRIISLTNTSTTTKIQTEVKIDSTGSGLKFDRWFTIGANLSSSSVNLNIQVRDSITFVNHEIGKWYQKKYLVMDGVSWNPNTSITGIHSIKIKESPNKWALVIGPGITYTNNKITPVLSITFGRKILER